MAKTKSAIEMTARWLERLQTPETGRMEHFDAHVHGLGIRLSSSGHRSWFLMYRVRGDHRVRRQTLGTYPVMSLAEARDGARAILLRARAGEDPATEKKQLREAPTVAWLVREYVEKYAQARKRSWKDDEKLLTANVVPVWGRLKVHEVQRRDVIDLLDRIKDRGAPIQANRMLACIRKMFNWAISRDIVQTSPCTQVKAPSPERQRDRVLSEAELRKVWNAIQRASYLSACVLKLRLMTAQRGGEVDSMRWQDIDLASGCGPSLESAPRTSSPTGFPSPPPWMRFSKSYMATQEYSSGCFPRRNALSSTSRA